MASTKHCKMKIATLQLNPTIREVQSNIAKADATLVASPPPTDLDLLVLPELAFTGYNFPSAEAIKPCLEATTAGPSTLWAITTAKRLRCHVIVGYPELAIEVDDGSTGVDGEVQTIRNGTSEKATKEVSYNSTVTISPSGEIIATYRKSFLYYTDESWAQEGRPGFYYGDLGSLGKVAHGICMDINPYQFTAPYSAFEFANHAVSKEASTIVLSMAWLTHVPLEEILLQPGKPTLETVMYWVQRFIPLLEASKTQGPITVVFSNRMGVEKNEISEMTTKTGQVIPLGESVTYAGSSCVMRFDDGQVGIYEMLGAAQEGLLVVDTEEPVKYRLQSRKDDDSEATDDE